MASRRTHDLVIKVGEYTDSQGQTKARTKNVGSVFQREDGSQFIALDATIVAMETQYIANPNRSDKVMVSVYEVREREDNGGQRQQGGQQRQQQQSGSGWGGQGAQGGGSGAGGTSSNGGTGGHRDDLDDDIPF